MTEAKTSFFREFLEAVAIAVVLAIVIRFFLFEPFVIPTGSMEPTLQPNDRIIVNKITYRFKEPQRGDVIVFKYPLNPKVIYIKRLIAYGGETLEIKNAQIYINGKRIPESYLPPDTKTYDYGPQTVPDQCYFVMGDNRNNSQDSRFWGPLPAKNVLGKAIVLFWPPGRLDRIK
jgi:signal peptidase I